MDTGRAGNDGIAEKGAIFRVKINTKFDIKFS